MFSFEAIMGAIFQEWGFEVLEEQLECIPFFVPE